MLGNENRPQPMFVEDYFRQYNFYMEQHKINAYVVEIEVPRLVCVQGLGLRYAEPNYNGPAWRCPDDAVNVVREKDDVTPFDVDLLCGLGQLIRQNGLKQKIKIFVNKNLKDMMLTEGLL